MRCRRALTLINELLDRELGEKDRLELEAHLETCSSCRQVYEDLKMIKTMVTPAGDLEPSEGLWERLKIKLQAEVIPQLEGRKAEAIPAKFERKKIGWFPIPSPVFKYAVTGLVIMMLLAGAFFLGRNIRHSARPEIQVASSNPALQKVEEAEYYYRKAIESLLQAVRQSENGLPPEMVEVLQANLNVLDRTIDLCQQAVRARPDDLQAREYLLSAYNSKTKVLNTFLAARKSLTSSGLEKL
ncbi:MAG: anti-sigma factor family protein [Candidatus Saccharicenans sp.]